MALLQVAAIVAIALYLVPGGAHVLEMGPKLALAPEQYLAVQGLYAGWNRTGFVLAAALILALWHAGATWGVRWARWLSLGAAVALAANLVVFLLATYPVNIATRNWTVMPQDFARARAQWEYSHAANAGLVLLSLVMMAGAVVASARARGRSPPVR